jgi:hypothetical protein
VRRASSSCDGGLGSFLLVSKVVSTTMGEGEGRGRWGGGGKMAEGDGGLPQRRVVLVSSSSCGGGDPPPAPGPAARVRADGQAGGLLLLLVRRLGFKRWRPEPCRGGRGLGQR